MSERKKLKLIVTLLDARQLIRNKIIIGINVFRFWQPRLVGFFLYFVSFIYHPTLSKFKTKIVISTINHKTLLKVVFLVVVLFVTSNINKINKRTLQLLDALLLVVRFVGYFLS